MVITLSHPAALGRVKVATLLFKPEAYKKDIEIEEVDKMDWLVNE